jgi:tetratricopeptide (TPR) repeat protein
MDVATVGLLAALGAGLVLFIVVVMRLFVAPRQISQIQRLVETGSTKQAVKALKGLLAKNEHNLTAHWLLCEAYYKERRFDLSLVECKYVVRLGKWSPEIPEEKVRRRLAGLLEQFNQSDEAQKEYILLSRLRPENGEYYFKIGETFYKRSMTDKAIPYLSTALKYAPNHAETMLLLGIINYSKGQVKDALDLLTKALQANQNLHKAHYYLGLIHRTLGIHDKARTEFQLAQKDPDFKLRALLEGGRVLFLTENMKEAIIELERALKFVKDENEVSIEIRYMLGLCYERTRDLPRAIEQWELVDNYRKGYKDTGTKLSLYADLRTDDKLKDFLTASREGFVQQCKQVLAVMNFEVQDVIPVNDDAVDFVASQSEGKWRNTKRSTCVVKIRRVSEPVGEMLLRQTQEEMKTRSATRGVVISTGGFAPSAMQFAQTRPIDLIDRKQLTQALHSLPS